MRFSTTVLLAATAVSAASVAQRDALEFPDSVPMIERRQEPGTPRYECHDNCGTALQLSKGSDVCTNSEFKTKFSACLDCALEFDIWQYYGRGLTGVAKKCNLDATPKPSGGTATSAAQSTSAAQATSSAAGSAAPSSAAQSSAAATSAAVSASSSSPSSAVASGSTVSTTSKSPVSTPAVAPTTSRSGGNSTVPTGTTTSVPTAGAVQLFGSNVLVAGAAIFVAANMM